ncbi:MAG: peptide chain release factor 2 [Planctomycetota bacterium]
MARKKESLSKLKQILNPTEEEIENIKTLCFIVENYDKLYSDLQSIIQLKNDFREEIGNEVDRWQKNFREYELSVLFNDEDDDKDIYFGIYAGAGGTDACDWVSILLRMYLRFFEKLKFRYEILEKQPGDEAGYRRVFCEVKGRYARGILKSEIGVHRLVRISPFNAQRKRQTSFAAVDVIPIYKEKDIKINPDELEIDTFRAGGPGGQHVNKTESAVRITHLPTGIVVTCQSERSQHKNRETALNILIQKLKRMEMQKQQQQLQQLYDSKGDIAWGHQIRSYIFAPYQLVKDHRTGLEEGNLSKILDGELEDFIWTYLYSEYNKPKR